MVDAWLVRRENRTETAASPWPDHARTTRRLKRRAVLRAWPDKTALTAAGIIAACAAFVWTVVFASVGTVFYLRLDFTLIYWTVVAELAIVSPLWLFLRVIDYLNGGPHTRARAARGRRIEPRFY